MNQKRKSSLKGMTISDIYEQADNLRNEILRLISEHKEISIKDISAKLGKTTTNLRNHTDFLYENGCIDKRRSGLQMLFFLTGKQYIPKRKSTANFAYQSKMAEQILPNARVIRLLDRKPSEISKEEHNANKKSGKRSSFISCSMAMFDGY